MVYLSGQQRLRHFSLHTVVHYIIIRVKRRGNLNPGQISSSSQGQHTETNNKKQRFTRNRLDAVVVEVKFSQAAVEGTTAELSDLKDSKWKQMFLFCTRGESSEIAEIQFSPCCYSATAPSGSEIWTGQGRWWVFCSEKKTDCKIGLHLNSKRKVSLTFWQGSVGKHQRPSLFHTSEDTSLFPVF